MVLRWCLDCIIKGPCDGTSQYHEDPGLQVFAIIQNMWSNVNQLLIK